jgi:Ca-activated chloride channel family protein
MAIMQTEQPNYCSQSKPLTLFFQGMLLAIVLFACAGVSLAQGDDPLETLKIDSDLVDLQVSVLSRDPAKVPVTLRQDDFVVTEDGAPQEVIFFASADAPFDLILLLDLSGSTSNKLKLIRRSSHRFVEAARPSDRIAIVAFSNIVEIVSPLTSNRPELFKAIKDIDKPSGGTNFWDALKFVLDVLVRRQTSRRSAVVVMTDGVDNSLPDVGINGEGSQTPFAELLSLTRRSDAVIYPVYLDTEEEAVKKFHTPKSAYALARNQLEQLANAGGSMVYKASRLEDLESVYERIIRDLGTVYSIGYRPKNSSRDGKWHSVSVGFANHPELSARTKSGYFAKALVTSNPN